MRNKKINKKRGGWKKRLSKIFRKTLNKKTGGKKSNTRKIKQTNQKGGLKENFGMSEVNVMVDGGAAMVLNKKDKNVKKYKKKGGWKKRLSKMLRKTHNTRGGGSERKTQKMRRRKHTTGGDVLKLNKKNVKKYKKISLLNLCF